MSAVVDVVCENEENNVIWIETVEPLYDLIVPERLLTGGSFTQRGPINSALHCALLANRLIAPDHCLIYFFTRSTDVIVPVHWRMLWKFAALISARASALPLPVFPQDSNATVCIFHFDLTFRADISISRINVNRNVFSWCRKHLNYSLSRKQLRQYITIILRYMYISL